MLLNSSISMIGRFSIPTGGIISVCKTQVHTLTGLFRFAYDEEPKVCLTVAHSCNCFSSCSALSCADRTMLCESARDRSLFYFFCYQALFLLHKPGVKRMTLGLFHFCQKSAIIQSAKGRQLMMTMWYSPSRTGRKSRYRE